ncbi:hypothetical protein [Novipirellula maiorica]|nr:hypothetical protein [Rhodopirellula maiorica]
MKITSELSLEEFREEMQHRVVKYPLNSRPVKEALRFAKTHEDPAFYRIASDKIHAQRQFQRELYGPGRLERLVDFFAFGSLKEVVVTLLLVGSGVVGLDVAKRTMRGDPDEEIYAHMDVNALADRLGLALGTNRGGGTVNASITGPSRPLGVLQLTPGADESNARLSDADVARIADAVLQRLTARTLQTDNITMETGEKNLDPIAVNTEVDRQRVKGVDKSPSLVVVSDESSRNP